MIGLFGLFLLLGMFVIPLHDWLGLSYGLSFVLAIPLAGFLLGTLNVGIRQPQLFRVWLLGAILSRGGGDR